MLRTNLIKAIMVLCTLSASYNAFAQEQNVVEKSANTAIQYSASTRHMWEVGLNGGLNFLTGDISWKPGFGGGIHIRKAIDNMFSLRLDGQYRFMKGFESSGPRNPDADNSFILSGLGYGSGPGESTWYHNYSTTMWSGSLQLVMSINQFRFIKPVRTINPYVFAGAGLGSYKVKTDAKDANGNIYNFTTVPSESDLDGTYETELAIQQKDLGKTLINPIGEAGVGIAFRITPRFNIGIEHKMGVLLGKRGDYVDGAVFRSSVDQTNNKDLIHSTYIRLNFNIGNKEKMSEPLWWVNPLDFVLKDIAELKERPKLDLTDTDKDGVLDMFDQEKETPAGAPVDVRGMALDSDGDKIPDYKDKEPYSAPNYQVDADGRAMVPKNSVSPEEVNKLIEDKLKEFNITKGGTLTDWFLPTIHFDLDKYTIKNSEAEKLRQVAVVMRNNTSLKVMVTGHTDKTAGASYNKMLSYNRAKAAIDYLVSKYGIARDRFVLTYSGKEDTLIDTQAANYMNRRVEFRVAKPGDVEMPKPSGPNAGSGKFEGSRDAGY